MSYAALHSSESPILLENIQEFYTAIREYYDELFPLNDSVVQFFIKLHQEYIASVINKPIPLFRFLGIGCATGNLENRLSAQGFDITGIDKNSKMIETANRRMKRASSLLRFFEMSTIEMNRFLKKESFNLISCIDDTLPYISDETLLRKFFHDTRTLLAPSGKFVIQTINYDFLQKTKQTYLPDLRSVRVTLQRSLIPIDNNSAILDASLELGNGQKIILQKNTRILPLTATALEAYGQEAGFKSCLLYGDFSFSPWTDESPYTILVFS